MELAYVKLMTPTQLVAEYNAGSGKPPIKKFVDRATAERRVEELRAKLADKPLPLPKNVRFPKRAAAIRDSWENEEVRARRSKRECVSVQGVIYKSTKAAFKVLGLPPNKCIAFRGKLKAAGILKYGEHEFKIVKQEELPL